MLRQVSILHDGIEMTTELDVLHDVVKRLAGAQIDYMLTGSLALNYYAEPRMTRDIDLVVGLKPTDAGRIRALFEPNYYVPSDGLARALANQGMFNLIHNDGVVKVDIIVRKNEPYRQAEFARRRAVQLSDFHLWIVSQEDLILSKLVWAKGSMSELQLRDVRSLLTTGADIEYIQNGRNSWMFQRFWSNAWMEDTSPEVKRLLRERYARLTGAERFAMGVEMFETARAIVLASLPKDLSAQELRKQLCARFYGPELAERVYGRHELGSDADPSSEGRANPLPRQRGF